MARLFVAKGRVASGGGCSGDGNGEDNEIGEDNDGVIAVLRLPEGRSPTLRSKDTPCPWNFPTVADSECFLEIAEA